MHKQIMRLLHTQSCTPLGSPNPKLGSCVLHACCLCLRLNMGSSFSSRKRTVQGHASGMPFITNIPAVLAALVIVHILLPWCSQPRQCRCLMHPMPLAPQWGSLRFLLLGDCTSRSGMKVRKQPKPGLTPPPHATGPHTKLRPKGEIKVVIEFITLCHSITVMADQSGRCISLCCTQASQGLHHRCP